MPVVSSAAPPPLLAAPLLLGAAGSSRTVSGSPAGRSRLATVAASGSEGRVMALGGNPAMSSCCAAATPVFSASADSSCATDQLGSTPACVMSEG